MMNFNLQEESQISDTLSQDIQGHSNSPQDHDDQKHNSKDTPTQNSDCDKYLQLSPVNTDNNKSFQQNYEIKEKGEEKIQIEDDFLNQENLSILQNGGDEYIIHKVVSMENEITPDSQIEVIKQSPQKKIKLNEHTQQNNKGITCFGLIQNNEDNNNNQKSNSSCEIKELSLFVQKSVYWGNDMHQNNYSDLFQFLMRKSMRNNCNEAPNLLIYLCCNYTVNLDKDQWLFIVDKLNKKYQEMCENWVKYFNLHHTIRLTKHYVKNNKLEGIESYFIKTKNKDVSNQVDHQLKNPGITAVQKKKKCLHNNVQVINKEKQKKVKESAEWHILYNFKGLCKMEGIAHNFKQKEYFNDVKNILDLFKGPKTAERINKLQYVLKGLEYHKQIKLKQQKINFDQDDIINLYKQIPEVKQEIDSIHNFINQQLSFQQSIQKSSQTGSSPDQNTKDILKKLSNLIDKVKYQYMKPQEK